MRAVASAVPERISLAEDALAEAGADVVRLDAGRVIRQPAFPHVYDANLVRRAFLREATLDDDLEKLAAPLREVGARHLQLTLDGSDVPDLVGPHLRRRGFVRDRLLAMTLETPRPSLSPDGARKSETPRPSLSPDGARKSDGYTAARGHAAGVTIRSVPSEAPWDQFAYAMDRMNREEAWYAPSVSREIVGSLRQKAELGALSVFVAEREGRVVGTVGLALHRGVASILSVGTLPDARRRGVGGSLVVDMVERARAARCDLVYLIARADDSPKEMYRKLGFRVDFGFDVWLRLPR